MSITNHRCLILIIPRISPALRIYFQFLLSFQLADLFHTVPSRSDHETARTALHRKVNKKFQQESLGKETYMSSPPRRSSLSLARRRGDVR